MSSDQQQAPAAPVSGETRACRACHAPLAPTQDWCLSCGAAASDRRWRLPGRRAGLTVAALTVALTGGAVAAAYAALTKPPGAPIQLAETVAPPGPPDTVPAPTTTSTVPTTPTVPSLPKLKVPKLPKVTGPSVIPQTPVPSAPLPVTPPSTTSTTTTTTTTTTTPVAQPVALTFEAGDVGPYDPQTRIVSPPSNRAKLFDGDETTAWTASALEGEGTLGFGITVDLQQAERLQKLSITGKAGGIEIYGTDADDLPQDVTDPAWTKLGELDSLDGQKTVTVTKKKKVDMVLLWFTNAGPDGPTVSLAELGVTALR